MVANQASTNSQNRYEILQNDKGEILIMLQKRSGGPETPLFIYDGMEKALLYRCAENTVYFQNIAEAARPALKAVTELQVVEIEDDDVVREYKVPVRIVKDVAALLD